jgi:hypothetical protein
VVDIVLYAMIKYLSITFIFLAAFASTAASQSSADRGGDVLERIREQRDRLPYEKSQLTMVMQNANGRTRERSLNIWSYSTDERSRLMIQFDSPADVRGTGLLSLSDPSGTSQKLYLPATRRVQTISSNNRGDKFLGSDFTFEDLGDVNHDDFTYETVSEQSNKLVVRATPKADTGFSYAYAVHTVDTSKLLLLSSTFYDKAGKPIRELTTGGHVEAKSGVWRSNTMTMKDVQRGSQTTLRWDDRTFDPISDSFFTERFLQRGAS